MKVIQVIQRPQFRGAEVFASQLSNSLADMGHDVCMVSLFKGDAALPFRGVLHKLNLSQRNRFFDLSGWKAFAQLVAHERPEVIQCNAGDTLKFVIFSKFLFRWKTPVVFRNANKMSDFIDSRVKWYLNNFLLHTTSYVVSVSKNCQSDLVSTFNFPLDRIRTIEIGIDFRPIGIMPGDLASIFKRGPVLLNVASLVPEKNQKGLLEIFRKILQVRSDVQLLIVGTGKLEAELRELAVSTGIHSNVYFLGARNDVLEIMQHAAAFVLPSKIEGLPGVILEAMYARCPVVAYDVGGISEVVRNGETGFLCKKDDSAGFIQSVLALLNGGPIMETMIDKAHRLIGESFDNRRIAERFSVVYEELVKPG